MTRPKRPAKAFRKGDIVAAKDDLWSRYVVDSVTQECVNGEWREYLCFHNTSARGAGNADLFKLYGRPRSNGVKDQVLSADGRPLFHADGRPVRKLRPATHQSGEEPK